MGNMTEQAISLFNENLQTMRNEGKANNIRNVVSLVKFASSVDVIHENVELDQIEEVNNQSYRPNGCTAMYDGIGTAINLLKGVSDYDDENVSFLVLVITDGEENSSKEFSGQQLSQWITDLEATERWTFTVLGANVDLRKLRQTLGIKAANVQNFDFSSEGFSQGSQVMTRGLTAYYTARSTGLNAVSNFYEDGNIPDLSGQAQNIQDLVNTIQNQQSNPIADSDHLRWQSGHSTLDMGISNDTSWSSDSSSGIDD